MIVIKAKRQHKLWARIKGLIGERKVKALYFETRFGIHTFFMKHEIDVVVLDNNFLVVNTKTLKPWRLFFYSPLHKRVIELPPGSIKKYGLAKGVRVKLVQS